MIHIGKIIKEELKKSGIKVGYFADSIGKTRSNVYDIFQRNTIDTDLLEKISDVIGYDFFQLYRDEDSETTNQLKESKTKYNTNKEKKSKISLLIEIDPNEDLLMNEAFSNKLKELMRIVTQ